MEAEKWQKIKAIFDSAIETETDKRIAYLDDACAGDVALRREVDELLTCSDAAGSFMERPFAGAIEALLTDDESGLLEPGQVVGRYEIVRKIGVGGMGEVYLAQDTDLKRPVALKLLDSDPDDDRDRLPRFFQEARIASGLNHPNIITVYEMGRHEDVHFMSTEFVAGESLRQRLGVSRLPSADAVGIAVEVASALVVAHEADIVHRDIKPENVMVRRDGRVKVLDFGLATLSRDQSMDLDPGTAAWSAVCTNPGMVMGTAAYMSPEQARGFVVDARTDIWSLGVVLYEMITGISPFGGGNSADVVAAILKEEPTPIKEITPDSPKGLNKIILKALSKAPEARYQAMADMLLDLKNLRTYIETKPPDLPCVAILPFSNMSRDASLNFFEFALADAVITELARTRSLIVRPSSAVGKYTGTNIDPLALGKILNVDVILAGNFLMSKNKQRIRVTTQLIDVVNENVLWAERIDSDAYDIIGLQDTITHRIVSGLKCELESSTPPDVAVPSTVNSHAYVEYLRGRDQLRRYFFQTVASENLEAATAHFLRAAELDPSFALAHCGLGTSYIQRVLKVVGSREDLQKAAVAFDHALHLDPQIVEARAYRAMIDRLNGETQRSREQLSLLRRDAPNSFEVQYLSAACYRFDGDYQNALNSYTAMLRIDPTAKVNVHYCRARIFWYLGDFDRSFEELELAERLEPNHPLVKFFFAIATFRKGDPATAAELMRTLFNSFPCSGFRPYLSMCLSALGEREAALHELAEETMIVGAVEPDVAYWIASAYLMAGETDLAFDWLERSIVLGNQNLPWFERNPVWESMFRDPRFNELMSGLRADTFA